MKRVFLTLAGHTILCLLGTLAPGQTVAGGSSQQAGPSGVTSAAEPPGTAAPGRTRGLASLRSWPFTPTPKPCVTACPSPRPGMRGIVAAVMGSVPRTEPGRPATASRFQGISSWRGNDKADAHGRDVRRAGRGQDAAVLQLGLPANDEKTGRGPPDLRPGQGDPQDPAGCRSQDYRERIRGADSSLLERITKTWPSLRCMRMGISLHSCRSEVIGSTEAARWAG